MMCFDCPHLDHVSMIQQRADWKPRDRCCNSKSRGDTVVIDDEPKHGPNRSTRRANAAKARKGKP